MRRNTISSSQPAKQAIERGDIDGLRGVIRMMIRNSARAQGKLLRSWNLPISSENNIVGRRTMMQGVNGLSVRLFGSGRNSPDLPPEVVKVFEKLEHFLSDDKAQNAALPEQVRRALEAGLAGGQAAGSNR